MSLYMFQENQGKIALVKVSGVLSNEENERQAQLRVAGEKFKKMTCNMPQPEKAVAAQKFLNKLNKRGYGCDHETSPYITAILNQVAGTSPQ